MMHIVLFTFTFLTLLSISILTITKPLFYLYAEYILVNILLEKHIPHTILILFSI